MDLNDQIVPATVLGPGRTPQPYTEHIFPTDNTRLAATLRVFSAELCRHCPLEWVDVHKNRESYVRHLEDPRAVEYQPKPTVTFNFDAQTVPTQEIVKAFEADLEALNANFEALLAEMPQETKNAIRDAVSALIARACNEALCKREELVRLIKRVPNNAKLDQIISGHRIVRLGKNCSPELRAEFLAKLPA